MELLQRPMPLAYNHHAVVWQGSSLKMRVAYLAGLMELRLPRRISAIRKALAIDVRSWLKANVPAPDNATRNARGRSRSEADVRPLQSYATPAGPVIRLPEVLGSQ